MYRYHRMRPKVSFALATAMVVFIGLVLTGLIKVQLDLTVFDTNPQAVLVGVVLSVLAALLLYEW